MCAVTEPLVCPDVIMTVMHQPIYSLAFEGRNTEKPKHT